MRPVMLPLLFMVGLSVNAHELREAIVQHELERVEAYLSAGGDPNAFIELTLESLQPGAAGTPERALLLDLALSYYADSIAETLLQAGADITLVEQHSAHSYSVLARAAFAGMPATVHRILELDPSALRPGQGPSPLVKASEGGHASIVTALLEAAAAAGVVWQEGEFGSALQGAAKYGHREVAEVLLDAGADVPLENALGEAVVVQDEWMVERLLQAGANPSHRFRDGVRVLDGAIVMIDRHGLTESTGAIFRMISENTADPCSPPAVRHISMLQHFSATADILIELRPECDWHALLQTSSR